MILGLSHDYNDPTFSDVDASPITIEDHVWIGLARYHPGVTLGLSRSLRVSLVHFY